MGIGDVSQEKGVKKYAAEMIAVARSAEAQDSHPSGVVSSEISIQDEHDAYQRICQLRPGARVFLLQKGGPDEPDCISIWTEPNIDLGAWVDSRSGQIALDMMLSRATYQGEVVYVLPHDSSCEVSFQVIRCVRKQGDDPK
jgi:hypothetical protein